MAADSDRPITDNVQDRYEDVATEHPAYWMGVATRSLRIHFLTCD